MKLLIAFYLFAAFCQGVEAQIVQTAPFLYLTKGQNGYVPCKYDDKVYGIAWIYGSTVAGSDLLVLMDVSSGDKRGPGYEDGKYDILDDYTLIIKEVSWDDEGLYSCVVDDFQTGNRLLNKTMIYAYVPPVQVHPVIEQCPNNTHEDHIGSHCKLYTEDASLNITCSLSQFFPNFTMYFRYGQDNVSEVMSRDWTNSDGTMNKSITITAITSLEPYECVALGIWLGPGEATERTSTVRIVQNIGDVFSSYKHNRKRELPIIAALFFSLIIVSAITYKACLRGVFVELELELEFEPKQFRKDQYVNYNIFRHVTGFHRSEYEVISFADPPANLHVLETQVGGRPIWHFEDMPKRDLSELQFRNLLRRETRTRRILLVGERGVGKTKLLANVMNDWNSERDLHTTELLFYIPLVNENISRLSFGEVVRKYLDVDIESLNEYIRNNERSTLIILDGYTEYPESISSADSDDVLVQIMRGDTLQNCTVIVTSNSSYADFLGWSYKRRNLYTVVSVEKFHTDNIPEYVFQYFKDDKNSAESLLRFLEKGENNEGVICKLMSQYPSYIAALCQVWRNEERRYALQKSQSISQFMTVMIQTLTEYYARKKAAQLCISYEEYLQTVKEILRATVGRMAYGSIMNKELSIVCQSCQNDPDAIEIAYCIGILTKNPKCSTHMSYEFRFHDKMLQEHMASMYLSSVFHANPTAFSEKLNNLLVMPKDPEHFENIWYSIAAQDEEVFEATVAFLHEKSGNYGTAISKFCNRLQASLQSTQIPINVHLQRLFAGQQEEVDTLKHIFVDCLPDLKKSLDEAARVIFGQCKSLELLGIDSIGFNDDLFLTMEQMSSLSSIKTVFHRRDQLGPRASKYYSMGICSMASLRVLHLDGVDLDDTFFKVMSHEGRRLNIESIVICSEHQVLKQKPSRHLAEALMSMPKLRSLHLAFCGLDKAFHHVLVNNAQHTKIERLRFTSHEKNTLDSEASRHFMAGVFSIPNLETLKFSAGAMDAQCFETFVVKSRTSKIQRLCIANGHKHNVHASTYLMIGVSLMPAIHSLYLEKPGHLVGELCSLMARSPVRIETLIIHNAELSNWRLETLLTGENLGAIRFIEVDVIHYGMWLQLLLQMPSSGKFLTCHLKELTTDDKLLPSLLKPNFYHYCSQIKKVQLDFTGNVTNEDVTAVMHQFVSASHMYFMTYREPSHSLCTHDVTFEDVDVFCQAISGSSRRLVTLGITDIRLGDEDAKKIIQMAQDHPTLETLVMQRCNTTERLDQLCEAILTDKLELRLTHGKTNTLENRDYDRYADHIRVMEEDRLNGNAFKVITHA